MKLLLATPIDYPVGGISRWAQHIRDYFQSLVHRDIELSILPMDRADRAINLKTPIRRYLGGCCAYTKIVFSLFQKLNEIHPDVFHLVSSGSISLLKDILMLGIAKRKRIKTVIHFHYGRIPDIKKINNWEWKLLTVVLNLADRVLVLDQMTQNALVDAGYRHVSLLPNPVSPKIYRLLIENSGVIRIPRKILFAGHVIPTKGVFELINACGSIPNIHLKVVGSVSDDIRRNLINSAGNANWLEIVGEYRYEETIKEMLTCDVFVLPTYTEGFPNVILESMACGCAIVTTNVGAIPEMLEQDKYGAYGLVIEPRKVVELRDAIKYMLDNSEFANQCRSNAQRRVNERYSMESVWSQLTSIWKETER